MFAAFNSSDEEQKMMAKATERLIKISRAENAHGNAGEASIFLALADRKLKVGGMLALVMPLSLMSGEAWENSRLLLAKNYSNLILVSIAGADGKEMSFSADTHMGECLVIGKKANKGGKRANFVILNERPAYPLLGSSAAGQIRRLIATKSIRRLEDGPVGGTPIIFGDEPVGQILEAPLPSSGGWNLARISDLSLAQAAFQLAVKKRIWLPSMRKQESADLPISSVSQIGEIGPYHADINGKTSGGGIRGPFDIVELRPKTAPTYPVLWSHDAENERTMSFEADCEGTPRRGLDEAEKNLIDQKTASLWATASHCHFNRDFRFNSQSLSMQFTPRRTIGGRAWLSIKLANEKKEKTLVMWANSSLGLLMHWWHSNKQQSGRGSIGKLSLETLPVLDVNAMKPKQLANAAKLFDELRDKKLLPLHDIAADAARRELDEKFGRIVLGLPESIMAKGGPLELLRMKLSREPSIRGQKL